MKKFEVSENDAGKLIKFIQKKARNLPASLLQKALRKKRIRVNGARVSDGKFLLNTGDIVELYINDEFFAPIARENVFEKTKGKIDIVYEDENIIIADKPAGLLCHEDERENVQTLLNLARKYVCVECLNRERLTLSSGQEDKEGAAAPKPIAPEDIQLCHRLDRNTRGLVVISKNAVALREMTMILRNRWVKKFYIAECETSHFHDRQKEKRRHVCEEKRENDGEDSCVGICKEYCEHSCWREERAYLVRDLEKKQVRIYDKPKADAKEIITKFRFVERNIVEVELVTGRTHQIRAHLAHLGLPLVGDAKYGNAKGQSRQKLTASRVEFGDDIPRDFRISYLRGRVFKI